MGQGRLQRRRARLAFAFALAAAVFTLAATAGSALARDRLTPGAVFTATNLVPNNVLAFNRSADGTLTPAGQFATGGNGRPTSNPPSGFPTLDSSGSLELSADGHDRSCLFVVNAGSNTVSSFRVRSDGLELADQEPTNGSRPISVTSTSRGEDKQLLYVLNSDTGSASIQGYYVSGSCRLTAIPGSSRPTSSPDSVPAQIRFDRRGRVLAVSERFANGGNGDIDIFPVDRKGVAGAPVVNPSAQRTPYGLDFNNHDILSVSNEDAPPPLVSGSTVTTYALSDNGTLTPLDTKPSPGAACWNVFTNNGKFLYVTKPLGQSPFGTGTNVDAFRVDRDGTLTLIDSQMTNHNALDDALSHNSRYLYVLSDALAPPAAASAINEFAIDRQSGALTPIGSVELPGSNSTAGLAAW